MSDQPERAREELRTAAAQWSHQGFHLQHYFELVGETEISLYEGSAVEAWEGLLKRWRALDRSLLLKSVQLFRIESRHLRARCAIAAAGGRQPSSATWQDLLRPALRDARRIEREATPWGNPLAHLIQAAAAAIQGRATDAARLLSSAESGFEKNDMKLYSSATRRALGLLVGEEKGRELVESADAWMAGQRIRNPQKLTAMLVPGPWSALDPTQTEVPARA
jgi:hypothetical protein